MSLSLYLSRFSDPFCVPCFLRCISCAQCPAPTLRQGIYTSAGRGTGEEEEPATFETSFPPHHFYDVKRFGRLTFSFLFFSFKSLLFDVLLFCVLSQWHYVHEQGQDCIHLV
jgi:hypothetical protein